MGQIIKLQCANDLVLINEEIIQGNIMGAILLYIYKVIVTKNACHNKVNFENYLLHFDELIFFQIDLARSTFDFVFPFLPSQNFFVKNFVIL